MSHPTWSNQLRCAVRPIDLRFATDERAIDECRDPIHHGVVNGSLISAPMSPASQSFTTYLLSARTATSGSHRQGG